jgi:hypothetical protein
MTKLLGEGHNIIKSEQIILNLLLVVEDSVNFSAIASTTAAKRVSCKEVAFILIERSAIVTIEEDVGDNLEYSRPILLGLASYSEDNPTLYLLDN